MNHSFLTLLKRVDEISFKEKGSRFIGYAIPVDDEQEVKRELENLWETHSEATHICYAYRLGAGGETFRANDDGEPYGSAGLPIYNQILSKGISFVLVAVVRYYGGTKLGVSGLVKAYKQSAQIVLEEAEIVERHLTQKIKLEFSYEDQGAVMRVVNRFNAEILKTEFTEKCSLLVRIHIADTEEFIAAFEPLYLVKTVREI